MKSRQNVYHKGSARMFKNDFIEKFSRVHPATPLLVGFCCCLWAFWMMARHGYPSAALFTGLLVGGYFLWCLTEYSLHRFFFHLRIPTAWGERLYFVVHGVHHDYPWDQGRLVLPLAVSASCAVLFASLFYWLAGPSFAGPLGIGFVLGYVSYDMTHWFIHARQPKSTLFKRLKALHLLHHFGGEEILFGVSCPWMDTIWGTRGQLKADPSTLESEAKNQSLKAA